MPSPGGVPLSGSKFWKDIVGGGVGVGALVGMPIGMGVGVGVAFTIAVPVGVKSDTCVGVSDGAMTTALGRPVNVSVRSDGISPGGMRVGVGLGTNPNSRRLEYSELEALAKELTRSGLP